MLTERFPAVTQKAKEASTEFARRLEAALSATDAASEAPAADAAANGTTAQHHQSRPPDPDGKYEEF